MAVRTERKLLQEPPEKIPVHRAFVMSLEPPSQETIDSWDGTFTNFQPCRVIITETDQNALNPGQFKMFGQSPSPSDPDTSIDGATLARMAYMNMSYAPALPYRQYRNGEIPSPAVREYEVENNRVRIGRIESIHPVTSPGSVRPVPVNPLEKIAAVHRLSKSQLQTMLRDGQLEVDGRVVSLLGSLRPTPEEGSMTDANANEYSRAYMEFQLLHYTFEQKYRIARKYIQWLFRSGDTSAEALDQRGVLVELTNLYKQYKEYNDVENALALSYLEDHLNNLIDRVQAHLPGNREEQSFAFHRAWDEVFFEESLRHLGTINENQRPYFVVHLLLQIQYLTPAMYKLLKRYHIPALPDFYDILIRSASEEPDKETVRYRRLQQLVHALEQHRQLEEAVQAYRVQVMDGADEESIAVEPHPEYAQDEVVLAQVQMLQYALRELEQTAIGTEYFGTMLSNATLILEGIFDQLGQAVDQELVVRLKQIYKRTRSLLHVYFHYFSRSTDSVPVSNDEGWASRVLLVLMNQSVGLERYIDRIQRTTDLQHERVMNRLFGLTGKVPDHEEPVTLSGNETFTALVDHRSKKTLPSLGRKILSGRGLRGVPQEHDSLATTIDLSDARATRFIITAEEPRREEAMRAYIENVLCEVIREHAKSGHPVTISDINGNDEYYIQLLDIVRELRDEGRTIELLEEPADKARVRKNRIHWREFKLSIRGANGLAHEYYFFESQEDFALYELDHYLFYGLRRAALNPRVSPNEFGPHSFPAGTTVIPGDVMPELLESIYEYERVVGLVETGFEDRELHRQVARDLVEFQKEPQWEEIQEELSQISEILNSGLYEKADVLAIRKAVVLAISFHQRNEIDPEKGFASRYRKEETFPDPEDPSHRLPAPYVKHILRMIVQSLQDGDKPRLVIATALHDAVEDTKRVIGNVTYERTNIYQLMQREFPGYIHSDTLVRMVTYPQELKQRVSERKDLFTRTIHQHPLYREVYRLCLDKQERAAFDTHVQADPGVFDPKDVPLEVDRKIRKAIHSLSLIFFHARKNARSDNEFMELLIEGLQLKGRDVFDNGPGVTDPASIVRAHILARLLRVIDSPLSDPIIRTMYRIKPESIHNPQETFSDAIRDMSSIKFRILSHRIQYQLSQLGIPFRMKVGLQVSIEDEQIIQPLEEPEAVIRGVSPAPQFRIYARREDFDKVRAEVERVVRAAVQVFIEPEETFTTANVEGALHRVMKEKGRATAQVAFQAQKEASLRTLCYLRLISNSEISPGEYPSPIRSTRLGESYTPVPEEAILYLRPDFEYSEIFDLLLSTLKPTSEDYERMIQHEI